MVTQLLTKAVFGTFSRVLSAKNSRRFCNFECHWCGLKSIGSSLLSLAIFLLALSVGRTAQALDITEIETQLRSDAGLRLEVHGRMTSRRPALVVTVRDPSDFFSYQFFSLIPRDPEVIAWINGIGPTRPPLKRHDVIWVKGELKQVDAAQRHIDAFRIVSAEIFNEEPRPGYNYVTPLPQSILGLKEIIVKVHAVLDQGRTVVVEFGDAVLPLPTKRPELTNNLYRGDIVRIYFQTVGPSGPTHIELDPNVANPIVVLKSMVGEHQRRYGLDPGSSPLEGDLVLFPASPQVVFDVYALEVEELPGVFRTYTLTPEFDRACQGTTTAIGGGGSQSQCVSGIGDVFTSMRNKLEQIWKESPIQVENGRNKLRKRGLRLAAKGRINVVDSNQANPQIYMEGPEAFDKISTAVGAP